MASFLIDASLPRPTSDLFRSHGHQAADVRDIGLGTASDTAIADHAKAQRLCLVSADQDFGNVLNYAPAEFSGMFIICPSPGATRATILGLVEEFLRHGDLIDQLAGRLAIVEPSRIRCRPPM